MLTALRDTMHILPFWVWVIIPAVLLGAVTYIFTRDKKISLYGGLAAIFLAWCSALFHLWKVFLQNHFIGRFDEHGLPSHISKPGWHLLVGAWPIWLFPTIVTIILVILISWGYRKYYFYYVYKPSPHREPAANVTDMQYEIELEALRERYNIAKDKIKEMKEELAGKPYARRDQKNIKRLNDKLHRQSTTIKEFQDYTESLETDLNRAKDLIEQLLEQRQDSDE